MTNRNINSGSNEIDINELIKFVWSNKIQLSKVITVFLLVGLLVAFTSRVEYKTSCKLLPESHDDNSTGLGGLGDLAGLAGINLNTGGSGSLSPELYPEITNSISFKIELLNEPIYFQELDSIITGYNYFMEHDRPSLFERIFEFTFGLPSKLKKLFVNHHQLEILDEQKYILVTKKESEIIESFGKRISVNVDFKTGIIVVETEMPDPLAAAETARLVVEKLTNRITNYKIEKSAQNLNFIKKRLNDAKMDYEIKQVKIAKFVDKNKYLSSSIKEIEYKRLQNELSLSFEVFKGLASQLEQAKLSLNEETPIFTMLSPIIIPVEKSRPKRLLIIVSAFLFGLLVSIAYSFYILSIKNHKL